MSEDSIERHGIKWGAEIAVDGKRPEWFKDEEAVKIFNADKTRREIHGDVDGYLWSEISSIVLPADHPYYAQEKREIDPALVERMVALIATMAQADKAELEVMGTGQRMAYAHACDIAAKLNPTPAQRFQDANPNWPLLDRAELIERVLAWKETEA